MTDNLKLAGRDLFWPPADELTEAAERIRARLGDWPPTHVNWRICLTPPDDANGGDLIVIADPKHTDEQKLARWLTQGAGVIEASADRAVLHLGGVRYPLEGHLPEDWIAAFAAFLDCGFDPHDALVLALAWRDGDETKSADAWPCDLSRFPRVAGLPDAPAQPFAACPEALGLYAVLPTADWVERVAGFGVKTVQLRRKTADAEELKQEIARSVEAGRKHDAQVFINDHWQAAIDAGAYGVHLGQEDVHTADLHALSKAGVRLGLSTHGYYEMLTALHFRPSYIALGAVFPTTTKVMPTAPQGLVRLARYVKLLEGVVPLVAIGGISGDVLPRVLETGVKSAAVVRAITEAADPALATLALKDAFLQQKGQKV